jgi:iron complex transport system substrate-binding protein
VQEFTGMEINRITGEIVDAAYRIHEEAGPGLLESVYERILMDILTSKGLSAQRQVPVPIQFGGKIYDDAFRADLIIENCVIIEIKSVDRLAPVHKKQVLTYLKLSGIKIGLLVNFGGEYLKGNIERLVMPGGPILPNPSL